MSDIYVFSSNEDNNDYSTMGLVGALEPTECKFEETANGDSLVTMTHPIDEFGKYTALVRDNILVIPVPVRTTPEIQNGSCVTTVWTYKVKPLNQLTSKNQRTLYKSSSGSGKRKVMNAGDIVTVVYQPKDTTNISRWKVKSRYGTGWIDPNGFELITEHKIEDNANAIQEVQSPWMITDQLFRIYEVERGLEKVTVSARHITYDLLYDATHYYYGSDQAVSLQTTLDNILGKSYGFQTRFHAYTNVTNTQTGLSFRGKNEIECFLDPEDGVCAKFDVDMIRDNYDLYFLHDPGINRGVRIQYGKNLTGISYKDNTEELVTRIIPTGETKNGEEFFLAGPVEQQCVDSKYINDYPVIHVYYMKCENCKIGDKDENGGKITEAVARARMRAQAQKMFDSGCDLPKIEMSVEFINLGDTEEYKQFKNLENCFLYDYVIIQHPKMNIDVTAQIVKMEWDCLLDRMNSVEIGTVGKTLANTGITSWQIPSGFSGAKIAQETIGSSALRSDIVAAKHIQSDTISANHIQANAVTAGKIAAGAITTDKLDAGSVTAEKIAAGAVEATKIKAGSITTDKLDAGAVTAEKIAANAVEADKIKAGAVTANKISANAVTAEKISAEAITSDKIKAGAVDTDKLKAGAVTAEKIASKTITADLIKAKTITADSGIIDDSAIGTAQIADGSITSAKIVELNADLIKTGTLSAERLLLVGEDGVIYKINAASSGLSMTELAKDQYKNYINGTVIVAKSITAAQIAAQSITGNEILAGSVTAKEINVSDLFASEATINELNAMDIRGNKYLQLYVTDKVDGISVGGRNLYTGTRNFDGDAWMFKSMWTADGSYNGCMVYKYTGQWYGLGHMITLEANTQYTLSAWMKQTDGGTVTYFDSKANGAASSDKGSGSVVDVGTDWSRCHVTFTVSTAETYFPRFEQNAAGATLWIAGLKLENGNKATDWSPAPEDIEERMSAAELKIEPDAIVSTVTSSASYKTLSSKADGNATDITGLKTRMTTAESKIDQKADSITLSVLETKVDGISVGGRNLLRNTNQGATNWGWSMQTGGKTVEEYLDGGVRACKMTRDAVEQTGWSVISYDMGANEYALLEPNTEYTLSFDYKPSVATTNGVAFSIRRGDGSNAATNDGGYWKEIPANEWTHVSGTFTTAANLPDFLLNSTEIYITRLPTTANSVHIFKNLKLEKGNKSTDWSPAPEDIEARVTTAESKIDQKADSITLSVLETKVDNISVGGRNYILNSDEYDPITGNGGAAQDCYIFKIADAFWSNDERIHSNIVFSFDWEWNTGLPGAMNGLIAFRASPYYNASFQFPAGQKTGHVSLSIDIPTLDYTATHLFIRLVNVSASYSLTIRNAKLEVGNKETDWSPAPEDPAGSLSVSSDYSKVDINTERVRIVSKRMEVAVPSEDGEDDVLRVDADGVHAEVVEADQIVSDSVVHTQAAESYTPANAGELAAYLEGLSGKCLTGDVDVNCINVSSGSFEVQGLCGAAGKLTLRNGALNALTVRGCGRNVIVYVESMVFSTSGVAVTVDDGAVMLLECSLNAGTGLRLGANWPSEAWLSDCEGDCTTLAALSSFSRLWASGIKPTGTLSLGEGSEVYNATHDPTFETATAPSIPTTQTVTASLSPTSTSTSGYGSKLYQGRYSSSQPLRKGVMLFSLPSDLTSADKIDSATLTIKRIGGVGQGGGVNVHVRCYDVPGTLYASKTAYENQTVSIDVTSAVKAMKTSGYTGLMLYNPETTTVGGKSYTASYSRFAGKGESGAPVLKISYRK